jgi:uncharacterized DUF497 family protein
VIHFIWDAKNELHIGEHGITPAEAEYVVRQARPPYPREHGDNKYLVRGPTADGRLIQVIYVALQDSTEADYSQMDLMMVESADSFYVIHARPLTAREKNALKRRRKRR